MGGRAFDQPPNGLYWSIYELKVYCVPDVQEKVRE